MGYGNGIIGGGGGERDGVQWRREILFGIQQLTLKVKRYLAWGLYDHNSISNIYMDVLEFRFC